MHPALRIHDRVRTLPHAAGADRMAAGLAHLRRVSEPGGIIERQRAEAGFLDQEGAQRCLLVDLADEPKVADGGGSILDSMGRYGLAWNLGVAMGMNSGVVRILVAWPWRPPERPAPVPA